MKFMSKECDPVETIRRIQVILNDFGIAVCEKYWEGTEKWHSVRLELVNLPGVGTNGKGVTREYALASAYAELMERLQTRTVVKPVFGNKHRPKYQFPDENVETPEYVYNMAEKLFAYENTLQDGFDLKQLLLENDDYSICAPFQDLHTGQQTNLPVRLIRKLCGTNGLCAGNTEKEAIVQGICEVYERYVRHKLFFDGLPVPTIDLNELAHLSSNQSIQHIKALGYECFVKDCTAGIFPALGLIIWDRETMSYSFTVGAHYDMDIALQRCVTEAFQGRAADKIDFFTRMNTFVGHDASLVFARDTNDTRYHTEWIKTAIDNTGYHPHTIFNNRKSQGYSDVFLSGSDNDSAYSYLLDLAKLNGFSVYSRNYSFMGFPTYQVFISKITTVNRLYNDEYPVLAHEKRVREIFLDLQGADEPDRAWLLNILAPLQDIPRYNLYGYPMVFFDILLKTSVKAFFPHDLLFLSYGRLSQNNFQGAAEYLHEYIEKIKLDDHGSAFAKMLIFAYLYRHNNANLEGIEHYLPESADISAVRELVEDGEDAFLSLDMPSCDDCSICAIRSQCLYEEWERIHAALSPATESFFKRQTAKSHPHE